MAAPVSFSRWLGLVCLQPLPRKPLAGLDALPAGCRDLDQRDLRNRTLRELGLLWGRELELGVVNSVWGRELEKGVPKPDAEGERIKGNAQKLSHK